MNSVVLSLVLLFSTIDFDALSIAAQAKAAVAIVTSRPVETPAPPKALPLLVCYQFDGCPPCDRFKADVKAGKFYGYRIQYRPVDPRFPQYPVFEINGVVKEKAGYTTAGELLAWVKSNLGD